MVEFTGNWQAVFTLKKRSTFFFWLTNASPVLGLKNEESALQTCKKVVSGKRRGKPIMKMFCAVNRGAIIEGAIVEGGGEAAARCS